MKRLRVAISQRVDEVAKRNETRDALDVRLPKLLWDLGFLPLPLPSGIEVPAEYLVDLAPDAVVLSGGNNIGGAPARDALERAALEYAIERGRPVLGICRGMQMLNLFQGGLLRAVPGHTALRHRIFGPLVLAKERQVNSYHDFSIMRSDIGSEFEVLAWSEDGVVEAFRHYQLPWLGIMWHPERDAPSSDFDRKMIQDHLKGNYL